jgi:hypothetical protein
MGGTHDGRLCYVRTGAGTPGVANLKFLSIPFQVPA